VLSPGLHDIFHTSMSVLKVPLNTSQLIITAYTSPLVNTLQSQSPPLSSTLNQQHSLATSNHLHP